ncbi:MAG: hypothetical protein H6825_08135 [Planctomycetes bacterium]|nr:hypothetical protein [Planctomycetota bacterium]
MKRVASMLALAAGLSCCGAPPQLDGSPAPLVVALPFRDLTGGAGEASELLEGLKAALAERDVRFVPPDDVERALFARRIRTTDSLSRRDGEALAAETGADMLLLGTILSREGGHVPSLAVSARLLELPSGRRLRSVVVPLRGDDFEGLLGLGLVERPEDLADEVVARLAAALDPRPGEARQRDPSVRDDALQRFSADDFALDATQRVLVLPLVSRTPDPFAGGLFSDVLADACFAVTGAQVVERSELVASLVASGVRSVADVDPDLLRAVGEAEGARWALEGSLDLFADDVIIEGERLPEIEASVRVLDLSTGRIAAAARVRRRGDDFHRGLGLGTVHDVVDLATRVARELVDSLGA